MIVQNVLDLIFLLDVLVDGLVVGRVPTYTTPNAGHAPKHHNQDPGAGVRQKVGPLFRGWWLKNRLCNVPWVPVLPPPTPTTC
jgi:hypothetical protein